MAERLAYLEAVVGADITEFRKSMRDIRNDVGILSETISGIGGAARTMTFAFTAPMVALGTYAVQAASGFDAAMRNINSIMQLSEDQFAGLSEEVMNFAKTTRAGVVPATEALYEIFSAGITDQARAMEVWKVSNSVAEAGVADLTQTTNAMTATMSAFNLETDQATRVGNVWSQMVKLGVGSLGDFLSNSQKILPLSAAMNISLEDMGATLAFLSQGGGGAAKAETAYAMMLSNMLKPTQAMTDTLKKLGVATGTELVNKFGSVSGAVLALRKAVDETTFNKMFSKTGLEAALRMTGNVDQMTEAIANFNDGLDTATMDAWAQQSQSFAFQWDLMKTSLEAVAITIGQAIMPLITPLIQGFSGFLQKVTEANPELVQLAVIFVGIVAAAAPVVWLLTSMISPIGLIIAGVTTLGTAFATNFDGIRDKVLKAINDITGGLAPLKAIVSDFMNDIFPKDVVPADYTPQEIPVDRIIKINPPEGSPPISLYDFYDGEGFSDIVSWDDFMKLATKGGWKGGAIKAGEIVTISGLPPLASSIGTTLGDGVVKQTQSRIDGWTPILSDAKTSTMFDRLSIAVTNAWPKVQTALDGMWSSFGAWVTSTAIPKIDSFGGDIMNHIAGWFGGAAAGKMGNTGVYGAVTDALSTDLGAAAGDAAKGFEQTFPELTAGLKNLFDNVGNWIMVEGIPTVARSIGFLAGKMGAMLRDGIGMIWQSVGGGAGAAKAAGAAQTAIDMTIFKPLSEGVQEGIGKNDGNIFDTFFDNLSAALLIGAAAWVLAPSVMTAIAKPIILSVTGAMSSAVASSAVGVGIKTMVTSLGLTMTTALGALSIIGIGAIIIGGLLSNPDIANGLKAWEGVWTNAKILISSFADQAASKLRAVGRDVSIFLEDITLKYYAAKLIINPGDNDAWEKGRVVGNTLLGLNIAKGMETGIEQYLAGVPLPISVDGAIPVLEGAAANPIAAQSLIDSITNPTNLYNALNQALSTNDTSALQVLVPITIAYEASKSPNSDMYSQMKQMMVDTGLDATTIAGFLTTYYREDPVKVTDIEAALQTFIIKPSADTKVDTTAITGGGDDWISRAIANQKSGTTGTMTMDVPIDAKPMVTSTGDAAKEWADAVVPQLPAKVMEAVNANKGNMDAAATSMTAPFVSSFNSAFAPEGTVTVVWHKFLTDYITDVTNMQVTTDQKIPLIQTAMVTAFDAIKGSVSAADDKLLKFTGDLAALVGGSPYKIVIDIETNGTMPTLPAGAQGKDDGAAAVGQNYIPFDNYRAVLHKGEMVLNKGAADEYRSQQALPMPKDSGGGVDNSSATFIINGVQNFDQFMREAKRRGYNLDKYRK